MAKSTAVVAAQSAIPGVNEAPAAEAVVLSPGEVETIEQLGRDYWMAEDAKAVADRKLSQCDVALFDIVKGVSYRRFMAIRAAYVTGCRDKGAASDEAAAKVWERAINRIGTSCGFERPKAESEAAKRMAEKRAEQAKKYEAKTDGELDEQRAELLAKGDSKSVREALNIAKEIERREKPVLDMAQAHRVSLRDKLIARAKELCKAGTADADDKMIRALQALS